MNLLLTAAWFKLAAVGIAQLNIPGADGSDGVLETPLRATTLATVTIDLSQAVTGKWDDDNSANSGKGVYDPEKWAVIFKYSAVNINTNTLLVFKNHPSGAPVVWLVSGDVNVNGRVELNARSASDNDPFGEPGPGGFRGAYSSGANWGFGPGGAPPAAPGVYATPETNPGWANYATYGNSRIVPLIGGSGAGTHLDRYFGGGGGGAILIAARNDIVISGTVVAYPFGKSNIAWTGGGGAIRLVAREIRGNGGLGTGTSGRIRLEAEAFSGNLRSSPDTAVVAPDSPPLIWPDSKAAVARILSVSGMNVGSDPRASLELPGADVSFQNDQPIEVVIETRNLDVDRSSVNLRITPKRGAAQFVKASWQSGDAAQSRWIATARIPQGYAALQVRAVGQ
ncbi:MAG: hypothetical protein AB7O66_00710 [Limisphaerales bacterium]